MLYFKHSLKLGSVSLRKDFGLQQDTADVMNFECEDSICTHAQAC